MTYSTNDLRLSQAKQVRQRTTLRYTGIPLVHPGLPPVKEFLKSASMRLIRRLESDWLPLRQRARAANMGLLRGFLRLLPAESHRVFALTLIVGALCGGAAVLFHLAIIAVESR